MTERTRPPTLSDAKGMGGINANEGFDYQLWDGLARVPEWIARHDFEELIFEGLEDLEARFFAPQSPHGRLLERFQAKSGDLKPADVREVFESFLGFESAYPNLARVQTLVTPRLPPTLRWIARDGARVRRARPFYAPFTQVIEASDQALQAQIVDEYGRDLGTFVASSVDVEEHAAIDRAGAVQAFASTLHHHFPHLDLPASRSEHAFADLETLARKNVGSPLSRDRLVDCVESSLGTRVRVATPFPILIRSDRNETDDQALVIDAAAFSGGQSAFPARDVWQSKLLAPMDRTARWLRARKVSKIALEGAYRLSTAMAIGWGFRSATGFDIEIPTREGTWSTNQHAPADAALPWKITPPIELNQRRGLVVAIGILREPALKEIRTTLGADTVQNVLTAQLNQPLRDGQDAQTSVRAVKDSVSATVSHLGAAHIDLFIAAPAAFAVALGHRWNGLPPTQLYEYMPAEHRYVATVRLQ